MVWLIGILRFICGFIGFFSLFFFISLTISSIVNPEFKTTENGVVSKYTNTRYILAIICSIAFTLLIIL